MGFFFARPSGHPAASRLRALPPGTGVFNRTRALIYFPTRIVFPEQASTFDFHATPWADFVP
jgi:hypothetical protein